MFLNCFSSQRITCCNIFLDVFFQSTPLFTFLLFIPNKSLYSLFSLFQSIPFSYYFFQVSPKNAALSALTFWIFDCLCTSIFFRVSIFCAFQTLIIASSLLCNPLPCYLFILITFLFLNLFYSCVFLLVPSSTSPSQHPHQSDFFISPSLPLFFGCLWLFRNTFPTEPRRRQRLLFSSLFLVLLSFHACHNWRKKFFWA